MILQPQDSIGSFCDSARLNGVGGNRLSVILIVIVATRIQQPSLASRRNANFAVSFVKPTKCPTFGVGPFCCAGSFLESSKFRGGATTDCRVLRI